MAHLTDALAAIAAPYPAWRVLGHSLGGFVALDLAARRPDSVTAVGLVSPTGPAVVEAVRSPLAGGRRLPWFAGMLLAMRTLAVLPRAGAPLMRVLGRLGVIGPLSAPLFAGRPDRSVVAALAEEVRPRAFTAAARIAAHYDLDAWRGVRCPVRSVRGAHDVFVGAGDAAAMAALLPDFTETVLPGAGHFAAIERPDAVLAALRPAVLP
jgi:pimeloyl-ACP methyl ester carboxylesterase